jgi:hypothetical protein
MSSPLAVTQTLSRRGYRGAAGTLFRRLIRSCPPVQLSGGNQAATRWHTYFLLTYSTDPQGAPLPRGRSATRHRLHHFRSRVVSSARVASWRRPSWTKPTHPHPRRTRASFRGRPSPMTSTNSPLSDPPGQLARSQIGRATRPRKRQTKIRRIEQRSAGKAINPGNRQREAP